MISEINLGKLFGHGFINCPSRMAPGMNPGGVNN